MSTWTEGNNPNSFKGLIEYIETVRELRHKTFTNVKKSNPNVIELYPSGMPICVHCPNGIENTAVFCAVDINISRLLRQNLRVDAQVNIQDTIGHMLLQRYGCFPSIDSYLVCYNAIFGFACKHRMICEEDLESNSEIIKK